MHPNSFDILVADAFSSDSVPQHLLTQQAFATYRRALSEDGLLLVHVSNRYLDLKPVVAAAAANGWTARYRKHSPSAEEARFLRSYASEYIVLSSPATIERLENAGPPGGWEYLGGRRGFAPWTDDYGSILPVLKILH
jgi:spermidine synthase